MGDLSSDCQYCGNTFSHQRRSAKYCSPTCRQAAFRLKQKITRAKGKLDSLITERARRSGHSRLFETIISGVPLNWKEIVDDIDED